MKKKLLLVEDEQGLARTLGKFLREGGYTVDLAHSVEEAKRRTNGGPDGEKPDLIILDLMLPDGSGLELLRKWRDDNICKPILILTAKSELMDKVIGLELGANDYITKPFEPRELLARIGVQFRILGQERRFSPKRKIIDSGIELDPSTRDVFYQNRSIPLTRMEFDLLQRLLESPNQVFSRNELLNEVWGYECFPTTRTVDNHISQLRRKINPERFEIVRRVGYRFVSDRKRT
jgi:DNA-binding response OmpR family regulator